MLSSLILFGSRARGDNRPNSDIDLLGITNSGGIEECRANGTSLYTYPIETLLNKARAGDLFVLHLVQEGRVIHDTEELFTNVGKAFRYKPSYESELRTASAVIWILLEHSKSKDDYPIRKRLVWGVRSILIARLAERRAPAFSSASLSEFANDARVRMLIDERSSAPWDAMKSIAADIANKFGLAHHMLPWPSATDRQLAILGELGSMATSTAKMLGYAVAIKRKVTAASDDYI